jgi:hypothetical protein
LAAAAGAGPGSTSAGNFGNQRAMPVPGVGAPRPPAGGLGGGWGGGVAGRAKPPGISYAQWQAQLEAEVSRLPRFASWLGHVCVACSRYSACVDLG